MKTIYSCLFLLVLLCVSPTSRGSKLSFVKETKDEMVHVDSAMAAAETPNVKSTFDFKEAFKELKSLSRAERRDRIKAAKAGIKAFKEDKKAGRETSNNTLLQVILAILLPPLGVYLHEGEINSKFWIDLVLTLLFFIPGVIYALIVVLGDNDHSSRKRK